MFFFYLYNKWNSSWYELNVVATCEFRHDFCIVIISYFWILKFVKNGIIVVILSLRTLYYKIVNVSIFFIICFRFVNFLRLTFLTRFSFVVLTKSTLTTSVVSRLLFVIFSIFSTRIIFFFDFANVAFFVFAFIILFHVFSFRVAFKKISRFDVFLILFFAYSPFFEFFIILFRRWFFFPAFVVIFFRIFVIFIYFVFLQFRFFVVFVL